MIDGLRRKMIGIMMAIAAVMLSAVFATLYGSTRASYQSRAYNGLRAAIRQGAAVRPDGEERGPRIREFPGEVFPALVLEEHKNGEIRILESRLYPGREVEPEELVSMIRSLEKPFGLLKSEHLRYLREPFGPGQTIRYALTDTFAEERALRWQIIHSVLIGCAALAIFFFISLSLSRWAVRPVRTAWEQQRQFISDASHELKTPLTVILSNVNLLLGQNAFSGEAEHAWRTPDDRARLRHIEAEALRMKELTEALLTLARSDSGQKAAAFRELDLSYVVNISLAALEPVAFEMGKNITGEIADGIMINGDESRLRRLTDILLDNACKYSREGGCILVSLSRSLKRAKPEALLCVASEGVPLSEDELKRIFQRFYRSDPSRGQVGGYGLGLPIAQAIVEEHRGAIWAESDGEGKNSFFVRLPV